MDNSKYNPSVNTKEIEQRKKVVINEYSERICKGLNDVMKTLRTTNKINVVVHALKFHLNTDKKIWQKQFFFAGEKIDILTTYSNLIKETKKPLVMITGEPSQVYRRLGNGSLATNHGLSAFDERLAYLSPVAYRYMFSGYINKQMKHYQLLDSDKYVDVSRIASDYDVAINGKYDINIHIDLVSKQTNFHLNNS